MRFFIFLIISTFFISNGIYAQLNMDTVYVNNSQNLIKSIKSNRLIIITAAHLQMPDEEFVINDVAHLKITGGLSEITKLTTSNTDNTVITFKNSSNIVLNNLSIGHWPDEGYCEANVIDAFECDSLYINGCDLFGSGVIGLFLRSSNVWCEKTTIRDCSEDIIDIRKTSLIFEKCTFYLNVHNKLDYPGPHFEACKFFNKKAVIISDNYSGFYPEKPLLIKANAITQYPAWSKYINDGGEFESVCPNTFSIKTSSQLQAHKNITYGSQNLSEISFFKGKNSAWVEGVDGDGIGEKIFFKVNSLVADYESWGISSEFRIVNGYAKNIKTWRNNNRVKKIKISRNNHTVAYIDLMDTPNVQSFSLTDIVNRNHFTIGEILEFEIIEVFQGDKYDDTAITYLSACCSP